LASRLALEEEEEEVVVAREVLVLDSTRTTASAGTRTGTKRGGGEVDSARSRVSMNTRLSA
jgi:hypothetical protein